MANLNDAGLTMKGMDAEQEWASARGFDLRASHWDDLAPSLQDAIRRVVRNVRAQTAAALPPAVQTGNGHYTCLHHGTQSHGCCADAIWNPAPPAVQSEPVASTEGDELADERATCDMLSALLRRIVIAVKGPEGELQRHSYADLPEKVARLVALIGQPPEGSHPDEWLPRAETWHQERENWRREVERLRAVPAPQPPSAEAVAWLREIATKTAEVLRLCQIASANVPPLESDIRNARCAADLLRFVEGRDNAR